MHILIATVTAGGGHLAAAAALDEAWRAVRPGDTVERLDLLKFFSPLHRRMYSEGYVQIAGRTPELWGLLFKTTDDPRLVRRLNRLKRVLPSASEMRFARHLDKFKPEVVLCTHHLPVEMLAQVRAKGARPSRAGLRKTSRRSDPLGVPGWGEATDEPPLFPQTVGSRVRSPHLAGISGMNRNPFVVSVVTDFEAHALWMDAGVDLYCVAADETKARLMARGASPEDILATGIPIAAKFSARIDSDAVRKACGLRDDLPVLLVLSGGFGMGPVAKILAELDKASRHFQTLVVTGRNEELRRKLAAQDRRHPTHVLGFASNMHELMTVADLIITKPGGLTSSEALALGKPLFILNPIPGQEAANSDFLLEHGAAVKVNRVDDLPYRVEQLLGSKKLAALAKAARALGRPHAARDICTAVVERMECG